MLLREMVPAVKDESRGGARGVARIERGVSARPRRVGEKFEANMRTIAKSTPR